MTFCPGESGADTPSDDTTAEPVDPYPDNLPRDLNFSGETISFFVRSDPRDEESSQIYDIIRESMVYDFGRIFNGSLKDMTYSLFRVAVRENNPAWASIYATNKDTLVAGLEDLMTKFTEE